MHTVIRVQVLSLVAMLSLAAPASAACDRSCLRTVTDQYLAALLAHNPSAAPLAAAAKYTENASAVKLGEGIWKTAAALRAHRQFYQDPVSGNALFRGVVEETGAAKPAIVTFRLKAPDGRITEVEAIISREGGHSTYSPDGLTDVDPSLSAVVPPAQRSSRERLRAISETYWDGIEKHDGAGVLSTLECQRVEDGRKMFNTSPPPGTERVNCGSSVKTLTHIKAVPIRRYYILDEEHGIAIGTFILDVPGTPDYPATRAANAPPAQAQAAAANPAARITLICEVFKIADGKIQYIEATLTNLPYEHGAASGWE